MNLPSRETLKINITTGTIVRFFLIAVLLAALYFISDILLVTIAAIILASAVEPIIRRLKRQHNIHRVITVVLIYVLIALVLTGILVFFLPLFLSEVSEFLKNVPETIPLNDLWSPIDDIGNGFATESVSVTGQSLTIVDYVKELQTMIVGSEGGTLRAISMVFGGFLSLILIIVVSFYLAVQEEGVDDFLRLVTPVKHHGYIIDLWKRSQRKIGLWLQGQILLSIIVGILVYIALSIIGIPNALVLALLAALLELIPVFGPIIASVPAILVAFSERGVGIGILVIVVYLVIQQIESHLLAPLVVKKIVGVSPIIVILAIIIGAKLAGVLGALIAVPLSAAIMEFIHDIEKGKNVEIAERAALKN